MRTTLTSPLPPREGEEVIKSDFDGHRHQLVFLGFNEKIDDGGVGENGIFTVRNHEIDQ